MQTTRVLLRSLTVVAVLTGNTVGHAALTPTETVKGTIVTVMTILNDPLFMAADMSEARREAIFGETPNWEMTVSSNMRSTKRFRAANGRVEPVVRLESSMELPRKMTPEKSPIQ